MNIADNIAISTALLLLLNPNKVIRTCPLFFYGKSDCLCARFVYNKTNSITAKQAPTSTSPNIGALAETRSLIFMEN